MSRGIFFLAVFLSALVLTPANRANAQWRWPEKAENLQVLPADFPASRLSSVMRGFTVALALASSLSDLTGAGPTSLRFEDFGSLPPGIRVKRTLFQRFENARRD